MGSSDPSLCTYPQTAEAIVANDLLNVGPTAAGEIPEYKSAALRRSGDWVRMHADAIYDGTPAVHCTGFPYGTNTVVRMAKLSRPRWSLCRWVAWISFCC